MRSGHRRSALVVLLAVAVLAAAGAAYVVKPGDTLSQIAARNDTTVRELAALNGISNPDRIRVGQSLEIPGDAPSSTTTTVATEPAAPAGPVAGTVYEVRPGDTLGLIARRNATSVTAIAQANRLANPNLIRVGQTLTIPVPPASVAPAAPVPPPIEAPTPAPAAGVPTTHVVQWGETLGSIAARYGTTVDTLRTANGLTGNLIFAGTTLRLTIESQVPPAAADTHTVQLGETLADVAARYGSTVGAIMTANAMTDPDRIVAGTVLVIPAASWICPVSAGTFFNDFGFPRSGGRTHEGNDIFAPLGSEVLAPVGGKVTQSTGPIGGNQFKLVGTDGTLYIGSHLDAFGAGGVVEAGDVIGYVGDTGNAKGGRTHLHFEMHPDNGAAVNPYPTLTENCR